MTARMLIESVYGRAPARAIVTLVRPDLRGYHCNSVSVGCS
jgi:hypothetical protein